jgi:hypothetical protein
MPDALDQRYSPATLQELGKMMIRLSGNSKTRKTTLKNVKELDPSFRLPSDVEMEDFRAEQQAKDEARKIEDESRKALERQEAQRRDLLAKYSEEQVKEIETNVMQKYGLSDYEAGAKLYAADFKPAQPSGSMSSSGAVWTLPDLPGLLDDPVKAARQEAERAIDEINRSKR